MKVFASRFLELPTQDDVATSNEWNWEPYSNDVYRIYASGNSTSSRESTYAAEKDNRSDSDRPNEGMIVA